MMARFESGSDRISDRLLEPDQPVDQVGEHHMVDFPNAESVPGLEGVVAFGADRIMGRIHFHLHPDPADRILRVPIEGCLDRPQFLEDTRVFEQVADEDALAFRGER